MGDSENVQQASRKRGALKELSRDNPGLDDDEEDSAGLESGTFKKASDEVLASRRIVRVKRKEPSATTNPFAGIRLVPATIVETNAPLPESKLAPAEAVVEDQKVIDDTEEDDEVDSKKVDVKDSTVTEAKDEGKSVSVVTNIDNAVEGSDETEVPLEKDQTEKEGEESKEVHKNGDNNGGLSSFQQHSSSKNAFTGLAGTESSGSSFSFSGVSQDGSTGSGPLFGVGSSIFKKSEGGSAFPPKGDVSTETGEENETIAFSADSVMFEYLDGGWKERGKGGLKVNVSSNGKARLVMRAKGNYRLILNASLYPEMKLPSMDKKGITFACVNSIGEGEGKGLSTFALKFKDPVIVEEFRLAVDKHKDVKPLETTAPLKTPENSPTATDA